MVFNDIMSQSIGKWDTIYQAINLDVFPKDKHKPCPLCGGKDRFRYDDKNGKGDFICNQCGAGDGINLIERVYRCTAKEAINKVAECLNLNVNYPKTTEKTAVNNMCDNPISKKVEYLLSQAKLGQSEYLTKKGLTFNLPLLDGGKIIAPLINIQGEYTGAQFIEANGNKQLMKGTNKKGSFIAIYEKLLTSAEDITPHLKSTADIVICEGLATGLTLHQFNQDKLIIIALDAGNLIHAAKVIRDVNKAAKIIIGADNDIGNNVNTGLEKAIKALECVGGYYSIPDTDYKCDWNDYATRYGIDETRKAFSQVMREIAIQSQPEQIKSVLQTLTKANIKKDLSNMNLSQMASSQRAELLNEYYDNNLAINMMTDEIYYYQNNAWQPISDKVLMRTLADLFTKSGEPFNPMRISSAVESLRLSLPIMGTSKKDLICFKNGVYELKTQTFRQHNKHDWLMVSNDIHYYPANEKESLETHAPNFTKWLKRASGNQEKAKSILAALYMILANRHDWQLFLEVTGAGGSGKSVFAEIATQLSGKNNTVIGTMESLEKARDRALVVGHSLIILPDQPRYVGSGAGLKAITGGDEVAIDPKHKQPYSCKIPAVILVINNEAMRFSERNGGISRRRVIFHFGEVIPEQERDLNLVSKIEQELPSIVRLLLNEFKNPFDAKERLHNQQQSEEATAIKRESDHLVDFCSYLTTLDYPNGMFIGNLGIIPFSPKKYLYHAYIEYMRNTGLNNPLSLTQFGTSLNYAINENKKAYIKKRTNTGVKTNLEINLEISRDWLPRAEEPN